MGAQLLQPACEYPRSGKASRNGKMSSSVFRPASPAARWLDRYESHPLPALAPLRHSSGKQVCGPAPHAGSSLNLERACVRSAGGELTPSPKALTRDFEKKAFSKQIMTGAEQNTQSLSSSVGSLGKWHLARELTQKQIPYSPRGPRGGVSGRVSLGGLCESLQELPHLHSDVGAQPEPPRLGNGMRIRV